MTQQTSVSLQYRTVPGIHVAKNAGAICRIMDGAYPDALVGHNNFDRIPSHASAEDHPILRQNRNDATM
jgi:hypothetical protein